MAKNYNVELQERRQIEVKWVGEIQPAKSSAFKIQRFNGTDGVSYEILAERLQGIVKQGETIDADVELRIFTGKDDQQYNHWVVTEIYIDGKPIPKKQSGRYYGRDEDRTDQRTFVMEVGADLRQGIIDKNHPFVKAREEIMASWVRIELGGTEDVIKTKVVIDSTPPQGEIQIAESDNKGNETEESTFTKDNLYEQVALAKSWKTTQPVHTFLVNKCNVKEEDIENNPAEVWKQVRDML
jgi:hypothetical protein